MAKQSWLNSAEVAMIIFMAKERHTTRQISETIGRAIVTVNVARRKYHEKIYNGVERSSHFVCDQESGRVITAYFPDARRDKKEKRLPI